MQIGLAYQVVMTLSMVINILTLLEAIIIKIVVVSHNILDMLLRQVIIPMDGNLKLQVALCTLLQLQKQEQVLDCTQAMKVTVILQLLQLLQLRLPLLRQHSITHTIIAATTNNSTKLHSTTFDRIHNQLIANNKSKLPLAANNTMQHILLMLLRRMYSSAVAAILVQLQ